MAEIVGGFATGHTLFPPDGVKEAAGRVMAGMLEMRARIVKLEPDAIVVVSSDHMNNFTLVRQVAYAVGIGDSFVPLGDMGLPKTPFTGARALGEDFARFATERGFDLVPAEDVRPDHGIMITKLAADPRPSIPTLPLYLNTNMPIPPTPARSFALGGIFRDFVAQWEGPYRRIVVVAGGGLSHWLCVPQEGRVNAVFDRHFMTEMVEGRSANLARMSVATLEAEAGNGGLELATWLFMAGTLPGARGEILYYEPISEWITGMGGLQLNA